MAVVPYPVDLRLKLPVVLPSQVVVPTQWVGQPLDTKANELPYAGVVRTFVPPLSPILRLTLAKGLSDKVIFQLTIIVVIMFMLT